MGFLQSMLVAWLYHARSTLVINIVVRPVQLLLKHAAAPTTQPRCG
jgi:hypothetical protein